MRNQLEKAYRSIQYLEYQLNEKNSQIELLSENVKQLETTNTEMRERSVAAKDYELLESKNSLIDANAKYVCAVHSNNVPVIRAYLHLCL